MDYIQHRLQKHVPKPVALAMAEPLVDLQCNTAAAEDKDNSSNNNDEDSEATTKK